MDQPNQIRDNTLKNYIDELLIVNQSINLTGAKDFERAWDLHVRDSLAFLQLKLPSPLISVDLGTGNGFPGVAVAAHYPECRVILVERIQKKAKAIEELAQKTGLHNVEIQRCDGRELIPRCPELKHRVNLVTARAVASLEQMIPICAPWLQSKGQMVFWKGHKIGPEELNKGREIAAKYGFKTFKRHDYKLDNMRGGCFIVVSRNETL